MRSANGAYRRTAHYTQREIAAQIVHLASIAIFTCRTDRIET